MYAYAGLFFISNTKILNNNGGHVSINVRHNQLGMSISFPEQ